MIGKPSLEIVASVADEPYALPRQLWAQLQDRGIDLPDAEEPSLGRAVRLLTDSLADIGKREDRQTAQLQYGAIANRLTRHSIDIMARQCALASAMVSRLAQERPPVRIQVRDCDLADRASLRFLAQAIIFSRRAQSPVWDLRCARPGSLAASQSRQRFLHHFENFCGLSLGSGQGGFPASANVESAKRQLVAMMWDGPLALSGDGGTDFRLLIHKVYALANVGEWQEAYDLVIDLAADVTDEAECAHRQYVQGLIETKKLKRPELGRRTFIEGLANLEGGSEDATVQVARGWLRNGLGLADTMLALRSGKEREGALMAIFQEQAELHRSLSGQAAEYLRYNVLANMAFILELIPRIPAAVGFWRRAFPDAAEIMSYRVGLLLHKMGADDQAIESLTAAVAAATRNSNPYQELHARYALVYVREKAGRRSAQALREALDLAIALSCSHLVCALEAMLKADSGEGLPEPDIKQVSTVPWAELDSESFENLNTYLVRESRGSG